MADDNQWVYDEWVYDDTRHREETLFLVRDAALRAGISEEQLEAFLCNALSDGILFRER